MLYALISIGVASLGQAILKAALNTLSFADSKLSFDFVVKVFSNYRVLIGLVFYFFSAVLWLYALSKHNLSRIYPLTSLSFIFVVLLSRFFLGESVSLNQAIGFGVIILGIGIVTF